MGQHLEQLEYSGPNGDPTKYLRWRCVLLERSDYWNDVDTVFRQAPSSKPPAGCRSQTQNVMSLTLGVSPFTVTSTKQGMSHRSCGGGSAPDRAGH